MASYFSKCFQESRDCFAVKRGKCTILSRTYFGDRVCPFYKTRRQMDADEEKLKERMEEHDNDDLAE